MPVVACPVSNCNYKTEDVEVSLAVALLNLHNNEHLMRATDQQSENKQKPPKMERPRIGKESSEETWNMFLTRWRLFTRATKMTAEETVQQLFACCEEDLGDDILRGHPNSVSGTVDGLLEIIKRLGVIPVAISVRRSELISTKQDHGEGIRSYVAKLRGKAATCAYTMDCRSDTCNHVINFTDIILKDVLVAGLSDDDIKKDVLGWADLDGKTVEETINFIEAKEMAREALSKYTVTAALSTYKAKPKEYKIMQEKVSCKECNKLTEKFVWSKRVGKMVECTQCYNCWRRLSKNSKRPKEERKPNKQDEANTIIVGAMEMQRR